MSGIGSFLADLRALPGRMSVRLRLTLLYGLLFFCAGALLMIVTYLLVADILSSIRVIGFESQEQLEQMRETFIVETMQQLIFVDPVPPSHFNPKIPRDLETICLKCLQKKPHLRYASALALAEDLERYLRGEASPFVLHGNDGQIGLARALQSDYGLFRGNDDLL